ncbi:MAG: hypothetical protein JNK53_07465, partial [Phycisphaerae bacterium]|nr:hypothetical protein [Phycisphaerae bacterium]
MSASSDHAAGWFSRLAHSAHFNPLVEQAGAGGASSARGASGSSTTFVAAAIAIRTGRPVLLVTAHLDEADEALAELNDLHASGVGPECALLPALESIVGEGTTTLDLLSDRLTLVRRMAEGNVAPITVAPFPSLMQTVPGAALLPKLLRVVREGQRIDRRELTEWLTDAGYVRSDAIESPCEFAIRGGVMDIFPPGGAMPVRLDLFGDELERIFEIDLATQASDGRVREVQLVGASSEALLGDEGKQPFAELLPKGVVCLLAELSEILEQGRGYWERAQDARGVLAPPAVFRSLNAACHAVIDVNGFSTTNATERVCSLPIESLPPFEGDVALAMKEIARLAGEGSVALCCDTEGELARAGELVQEHAHAHASRVQPIRQHVHRGFRWIESDHHALTVAPQHELLQRFGVRRRVQRVGAATSREAFMQF